MDHSLKPGGFLNLVPTIIINLSTSDCSYSLRMTTRSRIQFQPNLEKPLSSVSRSAKNDLPTELMLIIFQYVLFSEIDIIDICESPEKPFHKSHPLLPAMLACRGWKQTIYAFPPLWTRVYLNMPSNSSVMHAKGRNHLFTVCAHLKERLVESTSLHLAIASSDPDRTALDSSIKYLAIAFLRNNACCLLLDHLPESFDWMPYEDNCTQVLHIRTSTMPFLPACAKLGRLGHIHTLYLWNISQIFGSESQLIELGDMLRTFHLISQNIEPKVIATMLLQLLSRSKTLRRIFISVTIDWKSDEPSLIRDRRNTFLQQLAVHVEAAVDRTGAYPTLFGNSIKVFPFCPNLKVLSIAFSFTARKDLSDPDFGPCQHINELSRANNGPFQGLPRWLSKSGCTLSRMAVFVDPYSVQLTDRLKHFVVEHNSLRNVSELVLGLYRNKSYDHHTTNWHEA